MSSIFPSAGLSQAYTALTRFVGIEQNVKRDQGFDTQVKKAGSNESFSVEAAEGGKVLDARASNEGFKEYFVSDAATLDPNAPRGSYVNIVV
jgi:hypothetical protein